jgi:hypothetical protein
MLVTRIDVSTTPSRRSTPSANFPLPSNMYRDRFSRANGTSRSQSARFAPPEVNRPQWNASTIRDRCGFSPPGSVITGSVARKNRATPGSHHGLK